MTNETVELPRYRVLLGTPCWLRPQFSEEWRKSKTCQDQYFGRYESKSKSYYIFQVSTGLMKIWWRHIVYRGNDARDAARYKIPIGVVCQIRKTEDKEWRTYTTSIENAFNNYLSYDRDDKSYQFLSGGWLMKVYSSSVIHWEDCGDDYKKKD